MVYTKHFSLFCVLLSFTSLYAQTTHPDTIRLSIPEAEDIFIQKNLGILAEKYNVDINKAYAEQVKVWDNPVISIDQNVYDGKFFRHDKNNGQVFVQVQQLIRTAGKIKKQTQLANDNTLISYDQLNDLIRNLRYAVATNMNNLANLQSAVDILQTQLATMKNLALGMNEMFKLGDISEKDNMRIKALVYSLQNEYNQNLIQQTDIQKELASLLQLNDNVWIVTHSQTPVGENINSLSLLNLKDSAFINRPDLQILAHQQLYQQHNIIYQKAMAVPDLTIAPEYDQRSSYSPNLFGLTLSMPISVFNKNKGNIKAAEFLYKQASTQTEQLQRQINYEVQAAYQKLLHATTLLNTDNQSLQSNYDKLMKNMTNSYKERQVSLLEYIDFFEAYKDVRLQQNQMITNQRNAAAELNYTINQNLIKL